MEKTKWVEKTFFSYDERKEFLENNKHDILDHDLQTIIGTHGEEYILSIEVNKNALVPNEFEEIQSSLRLIGANLYGGQLNVAFNVQQPIKFINNTREQGPRLKAQGSRADQLAAHQGTRPRDQEIFFNYLIDIAPIISYIVIDWFGDPNR